MILLPLFRNRRIDVRSVWGFLSEREIRGLSSIFGAARKYGSGWIGRVILIGWKCSATLTVKLNYVPNINSSFFLQHLSTNEFMEKRRGISGKKHNNFYSLHVANLAPNIQKFRIASESYLETVLIPISTQICCTVKEAEMF